MSWEPSAEYYRLVNEAVRERLGQLHSAPCILHSLDFAEIKELQRSGAWEQAGTLLAQSAVVLERAGAGLIVLCTNTMHRVAAAIEQAVAIPFLRIADPTADAVREAGLGTVGLLGTRCDLQGFRSFRPLGE
jgi:aspartate racemase